MASGHRAVKQGMAVCIRSSLVDLIRASLEFPSTLDPHLYHLVKVGGHEYWVHRYEGALNGIGHAAVLLSYPKNSFGKGQALRLFLCSDPDFSDEEILSHYARRWKIEVMFKRHKMYLGLKSFMVRSAKAIDRLLVIVKPVEKR